MGPNFEVAQWMLAEIEKRKTLYQDEAADLIRARFGEDFVYDNDSGGRSIAKPVLAVFGKLSGSEVVWCRSDRYWRKRVPTDLPGRMQP